MNQYGLTWNHIRSPLVNMLTFLVKIIFISDFEDLIKWKQTKNENISVPLFWPYFSLNPLLGVDVA